MGIPIERTSGQAHPEGGYPVCAKEAEASEGQFGPQIKWTLESKEKGDDGKRITLTHFTSTKCSPLSKLGALVNACGLDDEEQLDTDLLLGKAIECRVEKKEVGVQLL